MTQSDFRQFAPATQRNREPILAVLQQVLPQQGVVLEIASGTGEHAVFLAPQLFPRYWLPSDAMPEALDSIQAWQHHQPAERLLPAIALDMSHPHWLNTANTAIAALTLEEISLCAIVNINMIHISPWSATLGLMAGAEALLPKGGVLYLYGPYLQNGVPTAPSNEAFDRSLRSSNPEWGIRNLEDVVAAAAKHGLHLQNIITMPANNLSVIFERQG
jgi:Protein of unknown function (DUF938)